MAARDSKTAQMERHQILQLTDSNDRQFYEELLSSKTQVTDTILSQFEELAQITFPQAQQQQERKSLITNLSSNINQESVWVYYPWKNSLVHLLKEEHFIRVRTSRNNYKITRDEQDKLATKTVGIVGLSVGQSVSIALTMERSYGKLKIADFDQLDLSNMNRIRTSLTHLGLSKTEIVTREIAEIDPFLEVESYSEGVDKSNLDAFLQDLDCLVDECDSLDMKILLRDAAKKKGIPVVMDTSDRGMMDIERFDLNPELEILHGLVSGLETDDLENLNAEAKVPLMLKMIGAKKLSTRAKASMLEVGQSIPTWPQLATSVLVGGAAAAEVVRRILLGEELPSGRFYFNLDDILWSSVKASKQNKEQVELSDSKIEEIILRTNASHTEKITPQMTERLITAGNWAPSGGNAQPWKWGVDKNCIYLFLDYHRAKSILDFEKTGSMIGLGAAVENLSIEAQAMGYEIDFESFSPTEECPLTAIIRLNKSEGVGELAHLAPFIDQRLSNRKNSEYKVLSTEARLSLSKLSDEFEGARLHILENREQMMSLGELIAEVDRLRVLSERGHREFNAELREGDEVERTRDGIDVETLELSPAAKAAIEIAEDESAIALLREWNLGSGLKQTSMAAARTASAFILVTCPSINHKDFFNAGRLVERVWLACHREGIAATPMSAITFFMNAYAKSPNSLPEPIVSGIGAISDNFQRIFEIDQNETPAFVLRLNFAEYPEVRSLRLPLQQTLRYQCYE